MMPFRFCVEEKMDYLPLFANLKNRPVLVVGGGAIALRKIELLLKAQAQVWVVAAELGSGVQHLHQQGKLRWLAQQFDEAQLDTVFLAIAATDDHALNHRVFEAAQARHRLVNVVDDQPRCSFIFPSIINRSPLQIAISSGGAAPVLARLWREKLEALLPQHMGAMAHVASRWRHRVKARFPKLAQRRRFWEKLFTHPTFHRLTESHQHTHAEHFVQQQIDSDLPVIGEVSLVGAGPGDAGLLTLKALQSLQQADVVLYDALVSDQVLELVRREAERIFVGKRAGHNVMRQDDINRLLVEYARKGKRVVRLKGGDPFVFGRGGEELEALKDAHIPFEVIPGITAALGATAYAGIPITHRDYAQAATLITGHCQPDGQPLDWKALAQSRQTLVVYMGTIKAAELAAKLQAHGRHADTPVAVISHGTQATQQVRTGTLQELAQLAQQAATPALLVIGEVVSLHHKLCWFGQQPQQFVGTHRALWHPLQTGSAEDPHASTPAATVLVPANAAETVETV